MDLRQEINKELDRFKNPKDLERLLNLIREYPNEEELVSISDALKNRIARGEEQARNGQMKTNEQVMARFDQWLSSK